MKKLVVILALFVAGCGIRGYHWASRGSGDTSAGDVTHASDSGARVVVPNHFADPDPAQVPVHCGVERWAVKTLADKDGEAMFKAPATVATISELSAIPAPTHAALTQATNTRFPAEVQQGRKLVHAVILGFKLESDSDIHIVLADPSNEARTMVAEIPSPSCVPEQFRAYFNDFRASFVKAFGTPTPRMKRLRRPQRVAAEGVFFFDFLHGQTGVAPNGAELHPLLYWKAE